MSEPKIIEVTNLRTSAKRWYFRGKRISRKEAVRLTNWAYCTEYRTV